MKPERFHRSYETQVCVDMLHEAARGSTVTYLDFAAALQTKDGPALRTIVQRSVRQVEREFQEVFVALPNEGYRKLTDAEISLNVGPAFRRKASRAASRCKRRLASVRNFADLAHEEQVQWNASALIATAAGKVFSTSVAKQIVLKFDDGGSLAIALDSVRKALGQ